MDVATLVELYPRLYHMAERGSWQSIFAHGLLSTSTILDRQEVVGQDRALYEEQHRPEKIEVSGAALGAVVLRDQKPMNDERLRWCLEDGLLPSDWYRVLNSKVFFWVSRERLLGLLSARAYREHEHDVFTLETDKLVADCIDRVRLCHINSGNTFPYPHRRGLATFKRVCEYPVKRNGHPAKEVVELVVEHSVPCIRRYVLAVDRMKGAEILENLYPKAAAL